MNVFTQITVSGFLLQSFFAGFPKFEKKKKKQKTAKTYTKAQTFVTVFEHVTDENNDMTPSPNFVAS